MFKRLVPLQALGIQNHLFLILTALSGLAISLDCVGAETESNAIQSVNIRGNLRTATDIIRRELLFAEGDLLDSTRIAETARNLRRLPYIGEVAIEVNRGDEGPEVTISVQDLYSRALSPLLSGSPDELSLGLVGLDYNLFGRGHSLRASFERRAVSGNWADASFTAPRLVGTRHQLTATTGWGSEGHAHNLTLARPFATLGDRRAYGIAVADRSALQRLYAGGELLHRYRDALSSGRAWYTHSYGHATKIRLTLRIDLSRREFRPGRGHTFAPMDRQRIIPSVGLLVWRPSYRRDRHIRDIGPLEDLQTGSWLSLRSGFARRDLGSDRTFSFYQAQFSPRFEPTRRSYVLMTLYAQTRYGEDGWYNVYALAEIAAYGRVGHAHSLAVRGSFEALHRNEDGAQLLLGLERGLRGFAPRRFDGTRRLRLNLEARPTFIRHPWYTLAGSAFVDLGAAWTPDQGPLGWHGSPGLGMRLGFPKIYNTPVFRGDIAYGLGSGGVRLSLGMGQYF